MRQEMIELLDTFGSDDDDEVVRAARQLHARVTEAGQRWQDLLAPEDGVEDEDEEEDSSGDDAPAAAAPDDAASLKLIAELRALPDCSDDLREELAGYEAEIASGELDDADRRYIGALHKRLAR